MCSQFTEVHVFLEHSCQLKLKRNAYSCDHSVHVTRYDAASSVLGIQQLTNS